MKPPLPTGYEILKQIDYAIDDFLADYGEKAELVSCSRFGPELIIRLSAEDGSVYAKREPMLPVTENV